MDPVSPPPFEQQPPQTSQPIPLETPKASKSHLFLKIFLGIISIIGIVIFSFFYLARPFQVAGHPIPLLQDGELVFSEKLSLLFSPAQVGDIVNYTKEDREIDYIGIVIQKDNTTYTIARSQTSIDIADQAAITHIVYYPFISQSDRLALVSTITNASQSSEPVVSPSPKITMSPSSTNTPVPSITKVLPSATPTPPPYSIRKSTDSVTMKVSSNGSGYAVSGLLLDQQGNVIINPNGFSYIWSVDDPSYVSDAASFNACTNGIQPPCPADHFSFGAVKAGMTTIRLTISSSSGAIIATAAFPLTIESN